MVRTVRFASAILAGLLGLVAAASAQVTVLSPAQQCVASANAGGTANALTIPLLPCGASTNILLLNVTATNTAAAPTLQMLGFAAHPIVASDGSAVPAGALVAGNTVMLNSQGQSWRLLTRTDGLASALTEDTVWIGNTSNQAEAQTVSGDITLSRTGLATLAPMPAHTFKGNPSGGTAVPVNMNATTSTAELNAMIGDSGAGGLKGLAPAPASGDAAAGKFLKADGTWAVASGGAGTLVEPTIAYTGAWNPVPALRPISAIGLKLENEYFSSVGGATLEGFNSFSGGNGLTQLELTNWTGVLSEFGSFPSGFLDNLASLSGPALVLVANDFDPGNLPGLTSLSFPQLQAVGGLFSPFTMNALGELNFPALKRVGGDFTPNFGLEAVASVDFSALVSVGGNFSLGSMPVLTGAEFPALAKVYGVVDSNTMPEMLELDFQALTDVYQSFGPHDLTLLRTISVPALARVGGIALDQLPKVQVLSFPALQSCDDGISGSGLQTFSLSHMASLSSLSLGGMVDLCNTTFGVGGALGSLATVTVNSATLKSANNFNWAASLSQASIDALLHNLVLLDGTGGTTIWKKSFSVSATTPSAAGLADITTICARAGGVFVRVNNHTYC